MAGFAVSGNGRFSHVHRGYAVVAAFNLFEFRDEAPLFRRLSERFDECAHGLQLVKRELDHGQGRPDGPLDPSRH